MGYSWRFIRGYGKVVRPLTDLLKRGNLVGYQKVFEQLKEANHLCPGPCDARFFSTFFPLNAILQERE